LAAGALALASAPRIAGRDRLILVVLAVAFFVLAIASGTRAVLLALPVVVVLAALVIRRAFVVAVAPRSGVLARPRLLTGGVAIAGLILALAGLALVCGRVAAFASDPNKIRDDLAIAGRRTRCSWVGRPSSRISRWALSQ